MTITGTTMLAGVAGWPISHSRSPLVHNYWFALHGIDGAYVPLPIPPDNFEVAVRGLQAAGFRGLNITVPHKEAAAKIADIIDESARSVGAANTLVFNADGRIAAANTDGTGFFRALKLAAPSWQADSGPVVVLGAGGAARAVVSALIEGGAENIRIVNRSPERAEALHAQFGHRVEIHGWENVARCFEGAALLVNTTTLGMQGQPPLKISLDTLPPGAVVNDLVYAPLETDLLKTAKARGLTTVDGLGMLLHQAAASFHIWFGVEPVIDERLRRYMLGAA